MELFRCCGTISKRRTKTMEDRAIVRRSMITWKKNKRLSSGEVLFTRILPEIRGIMEYYIWERRHANDDL